MTTEASLPTALIAEDVPMVRESLAIALREAGFDVVAAANGREALEALAERRFDVLVTDMWMPEVDGLRLLKEIRGRHAGMRVFGVTGGGPRLTIEAMTSLAEIWGAEKVFLKPFDEDDLVAAIRAPRG
ncbi:MULTISPECIES: response regulator [unclassified Aureimonas]|uniref:response regulator n=1 Tax=unclassified Aureimonas TaxID=2615206 RepID=UPI0009E8BC6A|nr:MULTISPECIES: response regulator [unclassified Aureimonas]